MSGSRPAVSDVDVDLGQLFASLVRNWLRILVFALLVAGAAFAYVKLATPLYSAETRILIENRESVFTRPSTAGTEADRPLLDEEAITTQVEIIRSVDLLRAVARELGLSGRSEFGGSGEMSALRRLLVLLGMGADPTRNSVEEQVLKTMNEKLSVYRVERSRVIVIKFSSEDPELAAAVPNAIAEAYLDVQQQARLLTNESAAEWLEPEIADLRKRVREAEARAAQFRSQADLMMGQGTTPLASQQLSELSSEVSRVRATRSAAEARAASIRSALAAGADADTLPEVQGSPMVQRLRERQIQLGAEIADLSTTLLDNHPRIRALRSQREEVSAQLRGEMRKVLAGLENEASAARERETALAADLNRVKAEAARAGDAEVELRALEREAAAQRALLESYLTRYREAASRTDRNQLPVDARIFARATVPFEHYFPRTVPIVGAAFVGALLLVAIAILLRELFSGRAMRRAPGAGAVEPVFEDAEPVTEAPVAEFRVAQAKAPVGVAAEVAAAPPVPAEPPAPREELSVEDAAERLIAGGATRAVFLSPEGDEATATSVMVAREVADAGLSVVFVDLTYAGAPSASMLESSHFPGITDLLASQAQFSEIIRGDYFSDCHVIPVGTADPRRAMRAIDRLPMIMQALDSAYDLVVVECGPTDAEGIRRVASEGAEIMVSVIEPGDAAVEATAASLAEGGFAGIVRVTPVGHERPTSPSGRSVA